MNKSYIFLLDGSKNCITTGKKQSILYLLNDYINTIKRLEKSTNYYFTICVGGNPINYVRNKVSHKEIMFIEETEIILSDKSFIHDSVLELIRKNPNGATMFIISNLDDNSSRSTSFQKIKECNDSRKWEIMCCNEDFEFVDLSDTLEKLELRD